jgi:hypothetical protein
MSRAVPARRLLVLQDDAEARLLRDFDLEDDEDMDFRNAADAEEARRKAEIPALPESDLKFGVLPTVGASGCFAASRHFLSRLGPRVAVRGSMRIWCAIVTTSTTMKHGLPSPPFRSTERP